MLKNKAKDLVVELKDSDLSAAQYELMLQVENHMHDLDKPEADYPNLVETLEMLLIELEERQPKAALIAREILKTLENIGI